MKLPQETPLIKKLLIVKNIKKFGQVSNQAFPRFLGI